MRKFIAATWVLGGIVMAGAPAFADDPANSASMTNARATHKKLMDECMQQQKSKKDCRAQVKDEMQRMNDAGTMPKSAVPGQGGGQSSSYGSQNSGSAPPTH